MQTTIISQGKRSTLENVFINVTAVYKTEFLEDQEVEGETVEVVVDRQYPTDQAQAQFDEGGFDAIANYDIQSLIDQAAQRAANKI